MARFKGRVVDTKGSLVTIDRTPKTTTDNEGKAIGSSWDKEDTPKINAVVRCNFHNRDMKK